MDTLLLCPICAAQYRPPAKVCPGCGCALMSASIRSSPVNERKRVEYVELCRPRGFPVAMIVKQMLEQNGVDVMVQGGNALSMLPHLAFGGELRVMVDASQIDFARELYQAYFESDEDTDFIADDSGL